MIDTRAVVGRLHTLESLAIIPRVASTNLIARRILDECLDNELSLPQAMIVAGEQFAGRGRNERAWSSPPGKGIYATTLLTRPAEQLPLFPLAMANVITMFLREHFDIAAGIKVPAGAPADLSTDLQEFQDAVGFGLRKKALLLVPSPKRFSFCDMATLEREDPD